MSHKIWMICSLLCASLILALLPSKTFACSGGESHVADETFLDPAIIGEASWAPFFVTPYHQFYTAEATSSVVDSLNDINLGEWDTFFDGRIPREAWADVLYKAPLDRIDSLIFLLKGKPGGASASQDSTYTSYADRKALMAALYYVGFAKRVEPYALERADYWAWDAKKDTPDRSARDAAFLKLIDGGTRAMQSAALPFLKRRYAFQTLRLHFYHDDYDRCLRFYQENKDQFSDGGSIQWRAMGYAAGALYKLKRYAEADYLYSVIYDQYLPLKLSAFWSFHPQEEADWRLCLTMAKSTREKAVLWQLLGIHDDGLRAMKEIYSSDPKSDLLPVLLVREVNWSELAANVTGISIDPETSRRSGGADLLAFVERVAKAGDALKPYAWDIAAGHLYAMAKDAAAATRCLDRAATRAPQDPIVQRQIRISRLYAIVNSLPKPDDGAETMLARELSWLQEIVGKSEEPSRPGSFLSWAQRHLSDLYRRNGDPFTALYFQDATKDPIYHDNKKIGQMIAFLEKPNKSPFEAILAATYPNKREDLVELQALNALYAGEIEKAATLLAQIPTEPLLGDPFLIHINDCHDCDHEAPKAEEYTKTRFVTRMADLQKRASVQADQAPVLYLELANGLYNMTCYGNARVMYDNSDFEEDTRITDCSRAEAYYRKAMELASDRELKAKACFMAAKCELNTYYNQRDPDKDTADFKAGSYFRMLKDSYSDTTYYDEVLKECGYFRTFIESSRSKKK